MRRLTSLIIVLAGLARPALAQVQPVGPINPVLQSAVSVASFGAELSPNNTGAACMANGACVTKSVTVVAGKDYLVSWSENHDTANNGLVTAAIDAVNGIGISQRLTSTFPERNVITAAVTGTVNLTFTITNYTAGTITLSLISLKAITQSTPVLTLLNSDGSVGPVVRTGGSGKQNTFYGYQAGQDTPNGFNSGFGYRALASGTSGQWNSAFGTQALEANTFGAHNSAFGFQALGKNTGCSFCSAFGDGALAVNTTGLENTAFGAEALTAMTTGSFNNAFGAGALEVATTGSQNEAFGAGALGNLTSGSQNEAIGYGAGTLVTTDFNNVFIGYTAGRSGGSAISNSIAIGNGTNTANSNDTVLGNSSTTMFRPFGSYYLNAGALTHSLTVPVIASGGCTAPAVTWANGTAAFKLTIGSSCSGVKTIVLTMPTPSNAWVCDVHDITTNTFEPDMSAAAGTSVTITNYSTIRVATDFTAGEVLLVKCIGG
jgi:hypothetical protein